MRTYWSQAAMLLLGISLTVGFYEGRRLVKNTAKALTAATSMTASAGRNRRDRDDDDDALAAKDDEPHERKRRRRSPSTVPRSPVGTGLDPRLDDLVRPTLSTQKANVLRARGKPRLSSRMSTSPITIPVHGVPFEKPVAPTEVEVPLDTAAELEK